VNLEFYDKKALNEIQKMDPSFLVIQDELLKYFKTLKPEDFSTDKGISQIQDNFVKRINNLYGKIILSDVLFGADTVITVMP
jgi:flagellar FliL protein